MPAKKRAKKNKHLQEMVDFTCAELDAIFYDRCDEEIDSLHCEIRGDNPSIIKKLDFKQVKAEEVLDHPDVRRILLGHINGFIEDLGIKEKSEDD